ncbi:hypothetical protein B4113_3561 [Geobacillus sp. B4113_201601]|nr:hypothetical protein B4113_3561 [Geobacillus sp. B4113_201601]
MAEPTAHLLFRQLSRCNGFGCSAGGTHSLGRFCLVIRSKDMGIFYVLSSLRLGNR